MNKEIRESISKIINKINSQKNNQIKEAQTKEWLIITL